MEELDEFGIPIKKQTSKAPVDEFGIPVKKKGSSVSNIPQQQKTGTTGLPAAGGSSVTPAPTKKKATKKEEESYLGNLGTSIMSGINDVNKMITSIPETVYNVFSAPQNAIAYATGWDVSTNSEKFKKNLGVENPILNHYKEEGKKLEKEIADFNQDRYKTSSIYENIKGGNYQDAFELLGSSVARSAPTSIALMAGGATLSTGELAAASTAGFYNQNLEQLQEENPSNSDIENNIKALGMSAAESVFSAIGEGQIGAVYRDILKKEGAEVGKQVFKDGLVQMYKGALEKYGVPIGLLGEGIEESATQITQNMISAKPAFEGVADAFITGGGSGVMFTAPISLINAKNKIKNKIIEIDDKKKINTILEGSEETFNKVFDVSKDSEINEKQLSIASLDKSRDLLVKELDSDVKKGNITKDQAKQSLYVFDKTKQITGQLRDIDIDGKSKVEVANLLKERESLSQKISGKDEALSVLEKQRIAEINEKIKETILKSKQDAIQEQTTDESVLRTEQPELELQGVGEGNAKPEGVTTEKEIADAKQKIEDERKKAIDNYYTPENEESVVVNPVYSSIEKQIKDPKKRLFEDEQRKSLKALDIMIKGGMSNENIVKKLNEKFPFLELEYRETEIDKINKKYDDQLKSLEKPIEETIINAEPEEVVASTEVKTIDNVFSEVDSFNKTNRPLEFKSERDYEFEYNKAIDKEYQAKRNIVQADDTDAAIKEYETVKKEREALDNEKENEKKYKDITSIIYDTVDDSKKPDYQYKELFDKDPRLAAIEDYKDLTSFLEQDFPEKTESIDRYKNNIKILEEDIKNFPLKENTFLIEEPTEVSPIVEETQKDKIPAVWEGIDEKGNKVWHTYDPVEGDTFYSDTKEEAMKTWESVWDNSTKEQREKMWMNDSNKSILSPIIKKTTTEVAPDVKPIDTAIKTLQESKEYIEADDIQKEALVRATRKEFGLKEKSAPSVNRLFGKLKDIAKITMTEKSALAKQLRDKARGARESVSAFRLASKEVAKEIKELREKGTITATQAANIISKFSKVNLLNEKSVSNFVDYMAKVFADANYAKNISEIKKLQRQAKSRNHTSMTNVVKEFTSINPELIPLDRLQDYIKALDFLNTRTPSYSNMNDILSEINSYKEVDDFDAVKTMDSLEKKYEKIELNKLKSVEEYVSLIRDINSFKRKAYQLLQEDVITQEEYDNLINRVGNDQAAVEKKYEKEIAKLKSDLINEIKKQRPKRNVDFSNEENNLIKKYLTLNDSDLKSLSPEDLFILNDILENISNGEIDYYRFNDVISKAFTNDGVNQLAKQIKESKFDMSSERGRQELSEQESSFWEGLLGMGRVKAGALQKFVISTFNRAIGSYESFIKDGYNEFLTLKKKYNIKDNEMHKIGILTTYLQEYMAQFDSKNKGIDSIGKRDWFKEILNNTAMKDNYSSGKPSVLKMIGIGSSEIEIIQKIWDKLPKDINGDVNPKDVYESYIANDGKFFAKNEKSFFDDVMKYKQSTITPKQKAANELSGNSFKEVPFHMLRVRLDSGKRQIQPSVSSENGTVRIKANTGKERISEKVGPVMTNFEKLFISNIEQTGRDYFLSGSLKDINNTLSGVKKLVNKDKMPLLNTISYGLSDALEFEFDRVENNIIFKNLLSARAATALLNPIRTGVELVSSLISYPIRAKDFSGYYSLFNEQGIMKKLLEFTDSPMLLRENISKAIDINDGRIKPQSRLNKATNYLSGLPERTMMVTSWMPSFKAEFKNLTDVEFDIDKFNNNESYREKYSKAIMESSAVADAQTEKIVGTTTKAGQRREVRIAPKFLANIFGSKGTVSKNTATGQILGFFSNYPFRESTEFINGFKEAAEVLKDEGALSSLSQLQKPFGIALNIASYGFFSTASYALGLVLLGDDDDEKRGNEILKDLMTLDGFLSELASNAISLAGSQYAAGGKAMLQIAATIGIMSADKEEDKNKIKKLLKDSVFINPLPIEQKTKFGGKDKALAAIGMYIPQFVILADRFTDAIGTSEDIKVIYDKVEKDGIKSLTEDEKLKILALNTLFNATQLMLNLRGTSIPEYNKLKIYMNSIKGEGGITKEELKKSDPEMYKIMYGND